MTAQTNTNEEPRLEDSAGLVLVGAVFLIAICGLVYELIAGTLSSYLLGDSVKQFSLVIGVFLTAMGVGSFLSKFIRRHLLARLAALEIGLGVVGGLMAMVGFATFSYTELYVPVLLAQMIAVGILVGLEIPLLVRILQELSDLRITLAHVLSADYLGALVASIIFPFLLLPHVGLVRAALLMGLLNVLVAGLVVWRFREHLGRRSRTLGAGALAAAVLLLGAAVGSGHLVRLFENRVYQDEIVYARSTPYQRLVITRWRGDMRLYLDGHLQFSSIDEYRYHEALVHPAMATARRHGKVLILGGGDGLAARQVLKYPGVESVEVVDIDPAVTELFQSNPELTELNDNSLNHPAVTVHNRDAMAFLKETPELYDVILMDLPDPNAPGLGKLYSGAFFGLMGRRLARGGAVGAQCTSPFRSREAFWCIVHTMENALGNLRRPTPLQVRPFHALVPTFGTWGFVVAGPAPVEPAEIDITVPTRYVSREMLESLFVFPPDMAEVPTPLSRLDHPVVSHLYRRGYHKYLQ